MSYTVRVLKINADSVEVLDNGKYVDLNVFTEATDTDLKFVNKTRLGHTNRPVGIFQTKIQKFKVQENPIETHTEGASSAVQVPDNAGEPASSDNGASEPATQPATG